MDRDYDPHSDDEREVELDQSEETLPPPTIDPEERLERDQVDSDDEPLDEDERPA